MNKRSLVCSVVFSIFRYSYDENWEKKPAARLSIKMTFCCINIGDDINSSSTWYSILEEVPSLEMEEIKVEHKNKVRP